jgi:DNA-directed RNA polymerase subunit omega
MARITIEDCIEQVPNRFLLVQMAAIRAKQLKKGARALLTAEENKEVVMSLREIAAGLVKPGDADAEPTADAAPVVQESAAAPVEATSEVVAAPEGEGVEAPVETPDESTS